MPSKTSFFNKTVYKKTLQRFWPLWAAYGAAWVLMLPVAVLSRAGTMEDGSLLLNLKQAVLAIAASGGPVACFFFAALAAMACFGWLYKGRSAAFTAALPVSRGSMFLSSAAAGLTGMLAPSLLAALLAWFCALARGADIGSALAAAAAADVLDTLCFFGFAVLCAQLTGSVIILPLVYIVLNFTFAVVEQLVGYIITRLAFGVPQPQEVLSLLSPLVGRLSHCSCVPERDPLTPVPYRTVVDYHFSGWGWVLAYAAFGVLCLLLAYRLYKRRRMETAEDTVAIDVLKPVFRWCLSLGCGLVLAVGVYSLLGNAVNCPGDAGQAVLLGALQVAGAVLGWAAADMLIYRSFGAFQKHLRGMALPCLVLAFFTLAVEADLTGAERRVPAPGDYAAADVQVYGETTHMPAEDFAALESLHGSVVADKALHESGYRGRAVTPFQIRYYDEDGLLQMERLYELSRTPDQLENPESDVRRLEALLNTPECILSRKARERPVREDTVVSASVHMYAAYGNSAAEGYFPGTALGPSDWLYLTPAEAAELYNNCLLPDLRDGTLGRISLVTDESYARGIYNLRIEMELGEWENGELNHGSWFALTPTVDSFRTNAWLEERGVKLETLWDYLERIGFTEELEYLGVYA